ncbi:hypothetical protein [Paenibacillus sp.]|uniref:hypothetical protein n=1 Tax=Paenibacillus sp. TaxID=58172 RepID=UPI002D258977|nr:hypothetical protein [Paenibacillus sp.]HZG56591.1 hypothetical protein [Paenibacillus sp.]
MRAERFTPAVAFVGHADSGRATLAAQVARYFHGRSLRVLAVVEAESPSDDLREKFAVAGASDVRFASGPGTPAGGFDPEGAFDVVVAVGFARSDAPKVFVFRTEEQAAELERAVPPVVAAVTKGIFSKENEAGISVYYFHELDELVDELSRRLLTGNSPSDIV